MKQASGIFSGMGLLEEWLDGDPKVTPSKHKPVKMRTAVAAAMAVKAVRPGDDVPQQRPAAEVVSEEDRVHAVHAGDLG